MSVSKPMYQPQKCDGEPCLGDCDLGCPLAREWWEEDESERNEA